MPEPLEGMTVIEMTIAVQGPSAALYLRDMGAEVIRIEPPIGDGTRYLRMRPSPDDTMGTQFITVNRGKRSICLDAHTELGAKAVMALLETADVFLTNFREPALEKMGCSYDQLKEKHPRLVYASVNGFGPRGPDANKAMIDAVAATRSGLINHTGYSDRVPAMPGAILSDTAGGMQLALGVMTALLSRERHGKGQRVQTSALGATLWLQQWELTHAAMTGANSPRAGTHHPIMAGFYGIYETKDGGSITLAQVMTQEAWDSLCIFIEAWDLTVDPRFQTPGQRLGNFLSPEDTAEIRQVFKDAFVTRTMDEWTEFLYSQPEIVWERARSWNEVLEDEQNIANDYLTTVNVPGAGETKTVGNLVSLSETPGSVKGDPPELGEANTEILTELGFTADEIAEIENTATEQREERLAIMRGMSDEPAR